ncbi:MAG: SpoIIE family protein phosphatase [Rhodospirillaceae bacterium]|nr:SpoIIE family protein phosphatase [Rhodospirillales bacterium]
MSEGTSRPTRCMVVDDERMNREVVIANLRAAGYETMSAEDGQQAWIALDAAPDEFDVIVLDRRMPRMDGMELLARLKTDERLRNIPVIMQTAYASSEDVVEGIKAGVYYYLGKPLDRRLLLSVTAAAIEEHQRFLRLRDDLAKRTTALTLMDTGAFRFRTLAEANTLAVALARACPRSAHLVVGLSEIFTNAIEHGNLGITFDEKAQLLAEKRWRQEVEARLDAPQNRNKQVTVTFQRLPGEVRITVHDEGAGFDWRSYVQMDAARAFAVHGRGIAMARQLSFDALEYRDPGNEVVCVIRDSAGDAPAPVGIGGQAVQEQAAAPVVAAIPDEMHIARRMQTELLPQTAELDWVLNRYGFKVSGFFETSSALGGDLWGLDPMDDHRFSLWLADFSGHGVTAALNTFRLHTLLAHITTDRDRPAAFLAEVNQRLAGLLPLGQYATMLYGVVDVRDGLFTYAAAAAPRPIVAAPGQPVAAGDGSGLPLGVTRTAKYVDRTLALPPGAALFLASDALTETPAEDGTKLGSAGAVELVERVMAERGGDVDVNAILAPFLATVKRPLRDDLTAVCCLRPAG